ncbi:MAG TPA: hypothetical protein VHI11_13675 [Jiangellaceae bacterium]|jgi:hypothetical protein|nr:hypothetical protein [Jiangellaceae bacterium]
MQRAQRMRPFSWPWLLTTASAVAGLAILGLYVAVILSEADDSAVEITPWVLVMATAALLPIMALFTRTRAIVAWCLLGSAAIWTVIAAISSLFIVAVPAVFLLAFAYASYRASTRDAGPRSGTVSVVLP